ncbi:MAG: hydroxysqualene dehydroxylase HpnE [Acidiferrobacterales bacterium]
MHSARNLNTLIIGGGWAGLAAAVELARHDVSVTVLEASRQLGGRARVARFGESRLDNGQHILLGAYHTVLDLLRTIGIPEARVLRRTPLDIMLLDGAKTLHLSTPQLPAPLHLVWALLAMRGIPRRERAGALRVAFALRREHFAPDRGLSVEQYLMRHGQGPEIMRALWRPLCLATLNTPSNQASCTLFAHVLRDAFFGTHHDSDLLVPITDLGNCFPEPARDFIEQRGGSVHLGSRVLDIHVQNGKIRAVQLEHSTILANHVIIATGSAACRALLRRHSATSGLCARLACLTAMPICTLYLQYSAQTTLGRDLVALLGTTVQWLFDRGRLTGEKGLMAAVISGPGSHMSLDSEELIEIATLEIGRQFPDWPLPSAIKLIRERRATFAASDQVDIQRPQHRTGVESLWLAGDYTATDYPSTLEGAARSGVKCAQLILKQ